MQTTPFSDSATTMNVLAEARTILLARPMPIIPRWQDIPQIMGLSSETLKQRRASLEDILAVLEVVYFSLRLKVNSHMGTWDSNDIMRFGTNLSSIDAYIHEAGDALIRNENEERTIVNLWPIFMLVRSVWNDLFGKGCIDI